MRTYASRTKEKTSDSRTVEQILAAYGCGELSVPCVRLQCIDFDETLYRALLAAKNSGQPVASGSRAAGKRRREDEDEDYGTPRRRSNRRPSGLVSAPGMLAEPPLE